MISHEHEVIFIHIPKCAGTSIEAFFDHFDNFEGRGGQDHRCMRMLQAPIPWRDVVGSASNLELVAKRFGRRIARYPNPRSRRTVSARQYRRYYKFAVIRDPRARVISWYRNVTRDPEHRRQLGVGADLSFDAFVERFAGRGMLAPTDWWLQEFDGVVRIDRLVYFDDLQNGFAQVCADLGLAVTPLPQRNTGSETSTGSYFSENSLRRLDDIYADEIRNYGF